MSGLPETEIPLTRTADRLLAHGTAVALAGRGILILGPSGSGKSALALALMALGARLIGDDRVEVRVTPEAVFLSPPPELAGRIEARFVGILGAETASAPLVLVVDLGRTETQRLPEPHAARLESHTFPCLHAVASGHFPAAIAQYVKGGRCA